MNNEPKKVVFIDRDGVINQEVGYLHQIKNFVFIDKVFNSCLDFISKGYHIIIITNQSGIGRGMYLDQDFLNLNKWMLSEFKKKGVDILDVFYCPHTPEDNCQCRKPKPGMFFQAQKKHQINMANSWMIGDKENDISAALAANIQQTILVESGHNIDPINSKAKFILKSIYQTINIIK